MRAVHSRCGMHTNCVVPGTSTICAPQRCKISCPGVEPSAWDGRWPVRPGVRPRSSLLPRRGGLVSQYRGTRLCSVLPGQNIGGDSVLPADVHSSKITSLPCGTSSTGSSYSEAPVRVPRGLTAHLVLSPHATKSPIFQLFLLLAYTGSGMWLDKKQIYVKCSVRTPLPHRYVMS